MTLHRQSLILVENCPIRDVLDRLGDRWTVLVLGANGEKLSKQNGAAPLELSDPLAALNAAAAVLDLPPATGGVAEALAVWTRAWHECWREA